MCDSELYGFDKAHYCDPLQLYTFVYVLYVLLYVLLMLLLYIGFRIAQCMKWSPHSYFLTNDTFHLSTNIMSLLTPISRIALSIYHILEVVVRLIAIFTAQISYCQEKKVCIRSAL